MRSTRTVGLAIVGLLCAGALTGALTGAPSATAAPKLRLTTVAKADTPIGFALHPSGTLYVVEQGGSFRSFADAKLGATALDVSDEISRGGEQGLLGAAFSSGGDWLFVNLTDKGGNTEIRAYPFANERANAEAMVRLLAIDQPYANHNGGAMVVDPDGVLWIGVGDGGSAGDPENRAQDLSTHLGKLLRIVPTPTAAKPYEIPPGNLAASRGKPEIWAYGLRNPWRIDIDTKTNTLWIGDVGQGDREEINAVSVKSESPNFGWKLREGTRAYEGGKRPSDNVDPVYDYAHSSGGCSVTGGVVYRGAAITSLKGSYLFSDYCDGKIRIARRDSLTGRIAVRNSSLTLKRASSFGVDALGEVYVASTAGTIAKIEAR